MQLTHSVCSFKSAVAARPKASLRSESIPGRQPREPPRTCGLQQII
jgi:hypothetical protein